MKRFIILVICLVMVVCTMAACGKPDTEAQAEKAALSATALTIQLGESSQLSVLNYAGNVSWSSSSTAIATVTNDGLVNAVAIGPVAITATLANGETMTCVVDVKPGQSLVESIKVTSIFSDSNDITVNYESGSTVNLRATCTPATDEKLTWSSSDELLATVDANGVVTVWGNGIAEIKATALNGVEGSCKVRIKNVPADVKPKAVPKTDNAEIPVIEQSEGGDGVEAGKFTSPVPVTSPSAKTSVIVSDKNVYLNVGEDYTLTYAVGNTDAGTVNWRSSDKAIAIVKNGRIVAVGEGRAIISAVTEDGAVASCSVAVGEEEIKKMKKEVSDAKK
ncbi:MAG: Ig-like domain-containing protein [Clostridia bacterium]|nr:Ig-like domain-containing protein [Clostridia bacterium]